MSHKKFQFACVDDQIGLFGWARAISTVLVTNNYLLQEKRLDSIDDQENSMYYTIFSPEDDWTFESTMKYLSEKQDLYDFYFIDIDLSKNQFIERPEVIEDRASPDLAGILLPSEVLSNCQVPKFIFTGSPDLLNDFRVKKLITTLIRNDKYVEFKDITNRDYDKHIAKWLDSHLRKMQLQVCSRLGNNKLRTLIDTLNAFYESMDSQLADTFNIPHLNSQSEYWSLRSLFPKQINCIEIDKNKKENHKYILNILQDWKGILSKNKNGQGLMGHLTVGEGATPERAMYKKKIERAKNLDFYSSIENYIPFSSLDILNQIHDEDIAFIPLNHYILNEDGLDTYLRVKLCPFERIALPVKNYFKRICNDFRYTELKRICETGIYPVDIAYIAHVFFHNKKTHNPEVADESCLFTITDFDQTQDYIQIEWYHPGENNEKAVATLEEKLIEDKSNPFVLEHEGYTDVVKIVCNRYKGELKFMTKSQMLSVSLSNSPFIQVVNDSEIEKGTKVSITIPKL